MSLKVASCPFGTTLGHSKAIHLESRRLVGLNARPDQEEKAIAKKGVTSALIAAALKVAKHRGTATVEPIRSTARRQAHRVRATDLPHPNIAAHF